MTLILPLAMLAAALAALFIVPEGAPSWVSTTAVSRARPSARR